MPEISASPGLVTSERRTARERGLDRFLAVTGTGIVTWESPEGWAVGSHLTDFVGPDDRVTFEEASSRATSDPGSRHSLECQVFFSGAEWRQSVVTLSASTPDLVLVTIRETTVRPDPAAELMRRANEDTLTGLDNRAILEARLRAAQSTVGDESIALLYLDVDHFKSVNDRLGHSVGDKVLRTVAERLRSAIRPGDTAARIGGDEFVVIAADVERDDVAAEIAERVRVGMASPIRVGGHHLTATISVGAAVGPARRATSLLEHADLALYRAKGLGRNRVEVYRPEGTGRRVGLSTAEQVLGEALDRDGLVVAYQPVVEIASQRVVAIEALLRLHVDTGPLQTPDALLRLAEESGLIVSLGAGLLDQACRQADSWSDGGSDTARRGLVWPMSTRHLEQPRAGEQALAILAEHGFSPDRLAVEVPEHSLIRPGPNARRNLYRLEESGVRLVIADFGAGPDSLALLRQFSPHAVKLDASYMVGFVIEARPTALVKGVLALCQALGITTIAQNVEDAGQLDLLRAMGCDQAQGPLLGDPVTAGSLEAA
jgi:diguanylate cyclase (GGDEF)-like protein